MTNTMFKTNQFKLKLIMFNLMRKLIGKTMKLIKKFLIMDLDKNNIKILNKDKCLNRKNYIEWKNLHILMKDKMLNPNINNSNNRSEEGYFFLLQNDNKLHLLFIKYNINLYTFFIYI